MDALREAQLSNGKVMDDSYGLAQQIHAFAPGRLTAPTPSHQPQDHMAG